MRPQILLLLALLSAAPAQEFRRPVHDLAGTWELRPDPEGRGVAERWFEPGAPGEWRKAAVPAAWETVLGTKFDGVAWYRRSFQAPLLEQGQRAVLRFHGAATEARVWVEGSEVGGHLGAWTPFHIDVTQLLRPGRPAHLAVRLDEKVGHNTQGFLPIIAPHFGGLWQGVELLVTGPAWLDECRIGVDATGIPMDGKPARLLVEVPVEGAAPEGSRLHFRLLDRGRPLPGMRSIAVGDKLPRIEWTGPAEAWSPGSPRLYDLELSLIDGKGRMIDRVSLRAGFRRVEADAGRILLNGIPLAVRGYLTWGYYPPLLAPAPSAEQFRGELGALKARGFNLVKFCLWLPPRSFLRIADEQGMLAWVEYPTWHPRIDQAHRAELLAEYTEMSSLDRNHASVIFRSITCETGPGADLEVITALYRLLKQRAPATLVVDDSSWIGWNRVHDFWDDHTYCSNLDWRAKLGSLHAHRLRHGMKPLLLGEAIAADTWAESARYLEALPGAPPWWAPKCLEAQLAFEAALEQRFGGPGFHPVRDLAETGLRYALEQRRWQIETFREVLPDAGYVVSTLRDVPLCRMGLQDSWGRFKWNPEEWSWHGPAAVPLVTPGDQRAFRAQCGFRFRPCARIAQEPGAPSEIRWIGPGEELFAARLEPGQERLDGAEIRHGAMAGVERPARTEIAAELRGGNARSRTSWELWALPEPAPVPQGLAVHGTEELAGLFSGAPRIEPGGPVPAETRLVATTTLSGPLLDFLEQGGRALLFPTQEKASWRTDEIWWLRGTLWAPPGRAGFTERVPRELLHCLPLYELDGGRVVRGEELWEEVDPLLAFIETHDLDRVRANLVLFETGVGRGRLIVSALRHQGGVEANFAGLWLARELAAYLAGEAPPGRALSKRLLGALRTSLAAETLKVEGRWRFRRDEIAAGVARGWFRPEFDDAAWLELRAASAEEAEAWKGYDGWGWYRQVVEVPPAWTGREVKLVFESVDDMYELYVNGTLAGGHGCKETRSDSSYLRRTWLEVGGLLRPGQKNSIAVRVYDWVGAAGLNGPVWFTTGPAEAGLDFLRR